MARRLRSRRARRILDFVLYIVIATALCGAVVLMALYTRIDGDLLFKWVAFAVFTAMTFYYPLSDIPKRLRLRRVWITWSALLAIHMTTYGWALLKVAQWRGMNFLMVMLVETPLISAVLGRTVDAKKPDTRVHRYD